MTTNCVIRNVPNTSGRHGLDACLTSVGHTYALDLNTNKRDSVHTMKMHDLSYEWDCSPCCAPSESKGEKKKRKEYPCLYIRGKAVPKLEVDEDGVGTATIKFRVIGQRNPSEGEKSLEIEVHEIGSGGMEMEDDSGEEKDSGDALNAELDKVASKEEGDED